MTKTKNKTLRTVLLAGIALTSVMPAVAQETSDAPLIKFEMKSQDLASALNKFAARTNREILFAPELVKNLTASPLSGEFAPKEALMRLLGGTGLTFKEAAPNVFVLNMITGKAPNGSGQAQLALAKTQAGENVTEPSQKGAGSTADASKVGAITGRVFDASIKRGLPGAILRLAGTNHTAVTDDRGFYRFPAVPPGQYQLVMDYIGIDSESVAIKLEANSSISQDFDIGNLFEEVISYGNRSATAQALNQQRSASNASTVVASDLMGSFPAETVAEALRRVPGVAFGRDDVTGEGSQILVRGFSSEAINVQLNGLDLQGTGFERTIDLNGFLADNISKVTIHKSLLPSQEASGSGGLVEIETRSGLDYGDNYFSIGIEREQSFKSDFGDEFQINTTGAWKFSDTFGVVGSVQYRETDRLNFDVGTLDIIPVVLPAGFTSIFFVPESFNFPFDAETPPQLLTGGNFQQRSRNEKNLTASLNFAWDVADHTTLKLDLQRIERDSNTLASRASLSFLTRSFDMPIPELGGEVRRRTVLNSLRPTNGLQKSKIDTKTTVISFRGDTDIDRWEFGYKLGFTKAVSKSNNQFVSTLGRNATNILDLIDPATLITNPDDDTAGSLRAVDGGVIIEGDNIPILSLTQAGIDQIFDPNTYSILFANRSFTNSPTEAYVGEFSARYNVSASFLDYIEVGTKYDRSERSNVDDAFATSPSAVASSERFLRIFGRDTFLSEFSSDPLSSRDLGLIGAPGNSVPFLRPEVLDQIFTQLPNFLEDDPSTPENEERFRFTDFTQLDPILNSGGLSPSETTEERIAAYIETKINIGEKLEVVGGVRWEQTNRSAVTISTPSIRLNLPGFRNEPRDTFINAGLIDFTDVGGKVNTFTPSILATYRESENLVVRMGYFRSTINPDFRLLSRASQIFLDLRPGFGKGTIREANPDLKSSKTDNFDLDIAYYFSDTPGILRAAFFYKKVNNNFTSVLLADEGDGTVEARIREILQPLAATRPDLLDLPADSEFFLNRPTNGEGGKIYGFELEAIRQLDFLPGFLSDFSVLGNVTFTDSDFPTLESARNDAGESITLSLDRLLANQSRWSGTASLAYEHGGFSGRIIYTFQSISVSDFDEFNLNTVSPKFSTLDLRASYRFNLGGTNMEIFLEGDDLLKSATDADIRSAVAPTFGDGSSDFFFPQNVQFSGGRTFTLGLQARF